MVSRSDRGRHEAGEGRDEFALDEGYVARAAQGLGSQASR